MSFLEGGFHFLVIFAALVREGGLVRREAVAEGVQLRGVLPFLSTGSNGVLCVIAIDQD